MYDHEESKEHQAAEARKALGLPPLRPSVLGKIVDAFIGRGDPLRECGLYRDKGCCYVDGLLCDFPVCDMNQDHEANPPTEPTPRPDEITDRDNDRCETCRHWTRVGDSLPNLGRCSMAEPHVDPMMPFDHHCCDHEPTIAAIMNRQWIPPTEPTPRPA